MKQLAFSLLIIFAVTSCSSEVDTDQEDTQKNTNVVVVPDRLLTMEIEGMVCEMGCGSSIRKELLNLGGVSAVEFDFQEERAKNSAKISFDKDKISVDEIIKTVGKINEAQFTVGKVATETLDENHVHQSNASKSDDKPQAEIQSVGFEIPNLLDFFAEIL